MSLDWVAKRLLPDLGGKAAAGSGGAGMRGNEYNVGVERDGAEEIYSTVWGVARLTAELA